MKKFFYLIIIIQFFYIPVMSQNEECYWKFSDEKYIFIENQFRDNILVKSDTTVYKKIMDY